MNCSSFPQSMPDVDEDLLSFEDRTGEHRHTENKNVVPKSSIFSQNDTPQKINASNKLIDFNIL